MIPANPSVILIHHDVDHARSLETILRDGNIDVITVQTRIEAMIQAGKGADAIILDMDMPEDSADLCRTLRKDDRVGHIPILALAGRALNESELGAILSAGAMDVLELPHGQPLFLTRVKNLVLIHREETQIKETEQRYRRIFSSSHYGYFLSSREGRFLEVNDALVNILGYSSRQEMLKLRLPDDLYVNPDDRDLLQRLIEKQGFVKDFKVDFKRKDGSVMTILLTANLYRSLDGSTVGYEGFNVPLFEVEPTLPEKVLNLILRPFRRFLKEKKSFFSVSRISELIANQYEKIEELSEGYYTSVWKGRDVLGFEEAPLVIKISKGEAVNQRLLLEAQTIRTLAGHPGIPDLVDVARHRGRTVIVTRYVEGQTLSDIIHNLDLRTKDRISFQLVDVVAHLHDHKIVHRDIKPNNIIVRPDGTVALLDYGIVRQMEEAETSSTIIGTRPYMSPEQVNGRSERRSDIWALGVVLFQMYTGHLPFDGVTELELMENILKQEPPTPRSLNPDIPAPMEAILIRALRKRPEGRFRNAAEMRASLLSQVPGFRDHVQDLLPVEDEPVFLVP
ncbi:MAG: protein kinase [bacterium]|nr:MAG: protein kinase [bacterium]